MIADCDKSEKLMEIMDGGLHDKLRSPDVVVKLRKEDMAANLDGRGSSCWLHPIVTIPPSVRRNNFEKNLHS